MIMEPYWAISRTLDVEVILGCAKLAMSRSVNMEIILDDVKMGKHWGRIRRCQRQ